MISNKRLIAGLFSLLVSTLAIAQENHKQSLQEVLTALQLRYAITFTYADDNIEGIFITPPSEKYDLTEALRYLHQNTGLLFQELNKRYVTIRKATSEPHTICGFIFYKETGEIVVGATVQSGKEVTISDEKGYFHMENLFGDSVIIRFVGYKSIILPVKELIQPCKKVFFQSLFITLQEILISDFITEGIDKNVDGSLAIQPQTLGMLPGLIEPDVLQTIQTLPGIQSIHETISDINVRGGTSDQNLVLWDGVRMYHSGHFFGLISAYNPYLTENVELIKNGSSATLGDAVSSTIDIRTDDQLIENFSAGAGINMINGDAFAKIPLSSKTSLILSSRRSVADLAQTPSYKQYFQRAFRDTDVTNSSNADTLVGKRENFYFYDNSFKFLYNITNKDKVRVSFLNVYNAIEYQENELNNNVTESRTSELEQHNLAASFSYNRLWNEKLRTSAQLYLSSYKLGAINFDLLNDLRLIQQNKVRDNGVKLDTRIILTKNINLLSGYQFTEVGVSNLEDINNPRFRRSTKKVLHTHVTFLEGNFTSNNTNIRAGVRGNYFQVFDKFIAEPRLSFNQSFGNFFFFEILAEVKNQTISQIIDLQSDFLGVEKRRWVLSNNNDIPIIRSKQVSVGVYYKRNNFLLSLEPYYKFVQGITTSSQGFQNQFQYVRSNGNYDAVGIDVLMSKKFDRWRTWWSYSNAKSTFKFKNLIPPVFLNNIDIKHRFTFGWSYNSNNLELSSGFNWHTGKPITEPVKMNEIVDNKINYSTPNSTRLNHYMRVDISAKYGFFIAKKWKAQVGASVWNILNRENIVNKYFIISDDKQLKSVNQASLGITPNVILRINF